MLNAAPVDCSQRAFDDTLAAVAVAGRIIDELRARLRAAESDVSRLEAEKLALAAALGRGAVGRPAVDMSDAPSDTAPDGLHAFIRGVDASFARHGACQ